MVDNLQAPKQEAAPLEPMQHTEALQQALEQQAAPKKKKFRKRYLLIALLLLFWVKIDGIPLRYFVFPFLSKTFYSDQWSEIVRVNGRTIKITRGVIGEGLIYWGKRSFKKKGEYIEEDSPNYSAFFSTLPIVLFDKNSEGQWFVLVHRGDAANWQYCYDYKQYVFIDKEWQLVELDKSLHGRERNLLWGYENKLGIMSEDMIGLKDKALWREHIIQQGQMQNIIDLSKKNDICK